MYSLKLEQNEQYYSFPTGLLHSKNKKLNFAQLELILQVRECISDSSTFYQERKTELERKYHKAKFNTLSYQSQNCLFVWKS